MSPLLASPNLSTLFMLLGLAAVFYLLLVRPVRKQAAAFAQRQEELRTQVVPGARVMLSNGLFGSVMHVGDKQVVVELAPGVQVTALKDSIGKIVAPEDEEFEFEDETDELVDDPAVDQTPATIDDVRAAEPADEWAAPVDPEQR